MDFLGNSQDDNKLDNDFRRILCVIKEYIQYVNSNHQLSLYRSWLEKLSTASDEKVERNMYLFELARQIKCNRLLPPFNYHPPQGSLKNLPKISLFRPSEIENASHENVQNNEQQKTFFHAEPITPIHDQNYPHLLKQFIDQNRSPVPPSPPLQNTYLHNQNDYVKTIFMQPSSEYYYHPCYVDEGSETSVEKIRTPTKIKKRKSKGAKCLQKLSVADNLSRGIIDKYEKNAGRLLIKLDRQKIDGEKSKKEESVKDDSSWCDLTDSSHASISIMASGDNKKSLPKVQEKVKQFNEVTKTVDQSEDSFKNKESGQNSYKKNKFNLSDEAEISRKIQNLTEAKISLKDTNFISSDWKKTIEGLQLRLTETLNQNNELKSIINTLQLKLKDESSKNKEQNESNQKKTEMRKREIDALQQIQADNIKKLEKSFHVKLGEAERSYQAKIEKLKANYETKIKELHTKHEHTKKDKNQEMCRLSEIIQQHCTRMSNEIAALRNQIENAFSNQNNDDKVIVLQKCVSKMDRLFQRSEKEYQKQIDKLKQELDLKDKVTQIQLKTQRAELIARTSVEKQKQFDEVINNLEIKYIKMLEFHESQVMEIKGKDEKKIEQLKQLLDENNIAYDNIL